MFFFHSGNGCTYLVALEALVDANITRVDQAWVSVWECVEVGHLESFELTEEIVLGAVQHFLFLLFLDALHTTTGPLGVTGVFPILREPLDCPLPINRREEDEAITPTMTAGALYTYEACLFVKAGVVPLDFSVEELVSLTLLPWVVDLSIFF
tara:strand:+ start:3926 stop:4384 length:459 start_codon:yes stop_codon:yes gene_type:complete